MTREIEKRLQKLEGRISRPPAAEDKIDRAQWLAILAVAYYLGDPQPSEALASAFARALGYANWDEFTKALDLPDFSEKYDLAISKLLAKFGLTRNDETEVIREGFERMEAGFSERYRQSLLEHSRN